MKIHRSLSVLKRSISFWSLPPLIFKTIVKALSLGILISIYPLKVSFPSQNCLFIGSSYTLQGMPDIFLRTVTSSFNF